MTTTHADSDGLLRKREAAHYLSLGLRTLDGFIQRRQVPFYKLGRGRNASVRFKKVDLDAMLEEWKVDSVGNQ